MMRLIPLSLVFVLISCSSTAVPPVNYYHLEGSERTGLVTASPEALVVAIERVQLAAFLLQSGLVMQHGVNQLQVSRQHLWAESLDLALPRNLQAALQNATSDFRVYLQGSDFIPEADIGLRLKVDSFQLTEAGQAVLAGSYQLVNKHTNSELVMRNFRLSEDLRQDGYPHGVTRLSALLEALGATILDDLKSQ